MTDDADWLKNKNSRPKSVAWARTKMSQNSGNDQWSDVVKGTGT